MEEALLHGGIVNIETKRMELEGKNLSRNEIRNRLSDQYRVFSRKQAFTCPCCDEPVNMNLTVDEGRPFYFKHLDGKECTYSENSKTYDRQVSSHQDKKKKEWVKNNQHGDTLKVSMKKLLNEMRESGIPFNQKDSIVQYPVKEFLVFYQSALKKDLKKKIEVIFLD